MSILYLAGKPQRLDCPQLVRVSEPLPTGDPPYNWLPLHTHKEVSHFMHNLAAVCGRWHPDWVFELAEVIIHKLWNCFTQGDLECLWKKFKATQHNKRMAFRPAKGPYKGHLIHVWLKNGGERHCIALTDYTTHPRQELAAINPGEHDNSRVGDLRLVPAQAARRKVCMLLVS